MKLHDPHGNVIQKSPGESASAAGAIAILITRLTGVTDPNVLAYVSAALLMVPAVIKFIVGQGGLIPMVKKVLGIK